MTICREWLLVKQVGAVRTAEPLKCRSWQCEYCAPLRRRQLIAEAIAGQPNTFITLTSNPHLGTSPAHRARLLVQAWRTIRKWAAALPGNGTVPFIAVFEKTKRGEPHLHILARSKWIDQRWLSRKCEQLGIGKVCWIERIEQPEKTARYIAKYCGKDPAQFDTVKRYWQSIDYHIQDDHDIEAELRAPATFTIWKDGLDQWMSQCAADGWLAVKTLEGAAAWNVPALVKQPTTAPPKPLTKAEVFPC